MKALLLSLFLFPQSEMYSITFQTLNHLQKPVTAKVKIYKENTFIKEYYSTGFFVAKLPAGEYRVDIINCGVSTVFVEADKHKTTWLMVNDDCGK